MSSTKDDQAAEIARLTRQVERVEALADEWSASGVRRYWHQDPVVRECWDTAHRELRAALSGTTSEELPHGLCGNREQHEPHAHHSPGLGPFWCDANEGERLPYAAEQRRTARENHTTTTNEEKH